MQRATATDVNDTLWAASHQRKHLEEVGPCCTRNHVLFLACARRIYKPAPSHTEPRGSLCRFHLGWKTRLGTAGNTPSCVPCLWEFCFDAFLHSLSKEVRGMFIYIVFYYFSGWLFLQSLSPAVLLQSTFPLHFQHLENDRLAAILLAGSKENFLLLLDNGRSYILVILGNLAKVSNFNQNM